MMHRKKKLSSVSSFGSGRFLFCLITLIKVAFVCFFASGRDPLFETPKQICLKFVFKEEIIQASVVIHVFPNFVYVDNSKLIVLVLTRAYAQ